MPGYSCSCQPDHRLVGDPVDTLTGAVFDRKLEFRLTGPLELWWYRHYDSSQNHRCFALGWGHTHDFDRVLRFEGDQIRYEAPVGRRFDFPMLENDGDEIVLHGFLLRRFSPQRYELIQHGEPAMEFERHYPQQPARLIRIFQGEHQILFYYDETRRLERIVDSTGRVISVVVQSDGRLTSLTLESEFGKHSRLLLAYHYDERGNLVATKNDLGYGYVFTYDDSNRMLMRRGRMRFEFHFTYDEQGRCVTSKGDNQLYGVALNYKVPGRLTLVTRADGGVWAYHFDSAGALAKILDPLRGVQQLIRDETGRLALELDPNENVTRVVYNAAGAPIAKIDPLGYRIPLPEDANAPDPLAHRVAANPAEYEYGRLLDVSVITLPDQAQVQELPLSSKACSLVFVRHKQKQSAGPERQYDVHPLGILWWPKPKLGRIFNDLGQLIQQRDELGRQRSWTYDASGNVADYIDFDGGKWSYDNGSWHLLRGVTNPLGAEVRFTYTTNEEVASCVDAGGTRSDYRYNLKDHLVEVRRHGVVRETYTRDAVGNLVAKHASGGRELLRFEIGPGNLPIKRTLASGDEHTFQYDKAGRRLIASTKKDRVEFAYDIIGNRVLEKRNSLGVEHRYQGWRRFAESVFFDRLAVRHEWRDKNTLVVTDPGGKSHEIQFLGNGLVERRFSNGSQETSQYDSLGRCLFKCAHSGTGEDWSRCYHWSGEGELLRVEDNRLSTVRHEYDAAHRLRRRHANGRLENYEMDLADNLVSQPGLSNVALQEGNRLKTANGSEFVYNDRNHIASRQGSDHRICYGYDSRDRLVRAETPDGIWKAEYDALGRRTRKTWAGQTTEYYWNWDQLVAEVYADGSMRLYIYADPLALSPLLFHDYDSMDASPESCQRYFVFTDQIGTPCLVEHENGTEVWRARIEPFGRAQVASTAKIQFHLRFPGHYFDTELNLHYTRFRHYDPTLGRYVQSDPWGIAGGFNLYAYCSNPLGKADVRGLGEGEQCAHPQEEDTEGTGADDTPPRRRMTDEELQSAADHIRQPGADPDDFSTLTVTEGMTDDGPEYTVTSSRGELNDGEIGRAQEGFGPDVNTPVEGPIPDDGQGNFHSEQRGIRATEDQTERRQASSNQTMGEEGNFGAACSGCAACQRNATDSNGNPNEVENVTGTVEDGGRTNNPRPGTWRNWSNE